jgi:DNA-binding NarL/FixJ family response regulator
VTIRVVVADDQEIVRTGLGMILDADPGITVVGQAADREEAVALARALRPDVCLFDIRMPRLDGVEATRRLAGLGVADPVAVVVITTFDLGEHVHAALRAGARGDALIAPSVTARLLATFAAAGPAAPPAVPREPLTEREEQVLSSLARGRTNIEIAAELHISLSTVKTLVANLMAKLRARNRVEIAIWAHETGRAGTDGAPSR